MHRLTNADADRLAVTLDEAALICRAQAAEANAIAAAAEATGAIGLAIRYGSDGAQARQSADALDVLASRLRARKPLWDNDTHQARRRLSRAGTRAIEASRRT